MWDVIKGLLGRDQSVQCFCTVYILLKKKQQELAKLKGIEAYYTKDRGQDKDRIVTFKNCRYVSIGGGLRWEINLTNLGSPWAGHFGVRKTLDLVSQNYYWPGMRRGVIQYVQDCVMYAQTKTAQHNP